MLTSRDNPMVKLCRRLLSGAKARREEGLFLVEGVRLCQEALSADLEVWAILSTQAAFEQNPWLHEAGKVTFISPGVAQAVSDTKTPQGVFCLCALPGERETVFLPHGRYLLLDCLQDPGNLGTILRGAEAFGVTAVVLGPGCPDPFSPKVLRSTMGSIFRQPFFSVEDLPKTIQGMKERGIPVYAALLEPGACAVRELPAKGGLGVVIGNEGNGVSPEVAKAAGNGVYIPMAPAIESLNAAAAATVIMWEMSGRDRK